jgi:integrase
MRDFILLALLTGARRANLCAMHWQEIDLWVGIWRIRRTKNDEPQSVTLCSEAVVILEARRETTGGGFVFPGTGETRYETHLDRKFERTLAMLLKLKDLRSA